MGETLFNMVLEYPIKFLTKINTLETFRQCCI